MKKLLLILLSAVLLVGCKSGKKDSETNINLGVMASMDYLPLAVAQREGYFDALDLKVKLHKFYSANERDAAFQSQSIDGCVIDYTGAVLQKSGGVDLRLLSRCDAPFYIVANNNGQINTIEDLKGKKIAISQNTVIDFVVDKALNSVSLTENDIEKVEVNKIPLRFELLKNGKIDATGLPNPFALMLGADGCQIITSNSDLGFDITGIMFHNEFITDHLSEIDKFYQAYNMGVDYLKSHAIQDIQDILITELAFPENILDQLALPDYSIAKSPKRADLDMTVKWLNERGLIDDEFSSNSLLDTSISSIIANEE